MHDLNYIIDKDNNKSLNDFNKIINEYDPKPIVIKSLIDENYNFVIKVESQEIKNSIYTSLGSVGIFSPDIK